MKQIVDSQTAKEDASLIFIKQFRKFARRGLMAKAGGFEQHAIDAAKDMARMFSRANSEFGFNIWINNDGTVGHTYSLDYMETSEKCHDYAGFLARLHGVQSNLSKLDDTSSSTDDI